MNLIPYMLPVAEIDIGTIIFWIVIAIITAINRASESAKKKNAAGGKGKPAQSRRPARTPERVNSAQEELEAFLQSLNTDVPQPKPQPQPQQQPGPKPQPAPEQVRRAVPPPPPPPIRREKPKPPAPVVSQQQAADAYSAPEARSEMTEPVIVCEREHKISELGLALRGDLREKDSIRKAIVLKEVLGPPLALRL